MIEARSKLLENLSLADNIFVMRPGFRMQLIPEKLLERQVAMLLEGEGVSIPVDAQVSQLSVYNRCVVELLRAKVAGVRLIILLDLGNNIRSASLEKFQALVRRAADEGMSFLYVCNRQEEAQAVADRIAIMENGRIVRVFDQDQWEHAGAESHAMQPLEQANKPAAVHDDSAPVLKLRGVNTEHLHNVSLTVRERECVILQNMSQRANADMKALLSGQAHLQIITENPIKNMLFMNLSYLDNLCFLCDSVRMRKAAVQEYRKALGDAIFEQDIAKLSPYELYDLVYYRVALAKPRVVLIIKPFAEADRELRIHAASLIRMLQAHGSAVIITTLSDTDGGLDADHIYKMKSSSATTLQS
jgi:ribose transport system ATP-binding protein